MIVCNLSRVFLYFFIFLFVETFSYASQMEEMVGTSTPIVRPSDRQEGKDSVVTHSEGRQEEAKTRTISLYHIPTAFS